MTKDKKTKGNVPNLRFPEFTGEWEKKKINSFTTVKAGATPSTLKPEYWNGNIRWMSSGELNNKRIYEVNGRITELGLQKTSTTLIPIGCVLIGLAGQGKTRGTAAINHVELCTNQSIASILPSTEVDTEFLYQNIESRYQELRDISSGDGGRGGLNLKIIGNLFVPVCSIKEQQKIAKFLSLLDKRIATQNKIIEKYESLIKGLNNLIFENLGNKNLIPFSKLYEKAGEGGTPDTKKSDYYENGQIPFVKIDDLKDKYLENVESFIAEEGLKKSSAWVIPAYSIIFSNGATIGSISINKFPVTTKQGILGIVLKKNISLEYIYYFMTSQHFRKEICKITTHGTIKTAYLRDIDSIQCFIPSRKEQDRIAKILSLISSKIEIEQSTFESLKFQRQYLLKQMFI